MSIITLAEVKALGRIGFDTHDTLLTSLIEEVLAFIEKYCQFKLSSATYTDERVDGGQESLWLRNLPVTAVSVIEDGWNSDDIIDATSYFFQETRVVADNGATWGVGDLRWKVTYTAGYTDLTAPIGLRTPARALVLLAYNNAEGKTRQAAAGYGTDWSKLAEEHDILTQLDQYSLRRYAE